MLKRLVLLSSVMFTVVGFAQKSETDINAPGVLTDAALQKRAFKAVQPTEDRVETWEVTALGQTTYAASNVMDGSANSFQHSMRLVVGLVTPGYKGGTCQLVFYGADDKIQQAVSVENGLISIFYPLSVYESLRARLDQAIVARKKIQVKITQKTNGYREGVLVF